MKKIRRYYIRILVFLSLAAVAPTLWLGIFINYRTSDLLWDAEEKEVLRTLEQYAYTIDFISNNIENTVILLGMSGTFSKYQHIPDKDYFRNFHQNYNLERISEYALFLQYRAEINKSLEQFVSTLNFIRSIYYYDPQVDEIFSMEFIPMPAGRFPESDVAELLSTSKNTGISHYVNSRNGQSEIILVYPDNLGGSGTFAVILDAWRLYTFLWNHIKPSMFYDVMALDEQDRTILSDPLHQDETARLTDAFSQLPGGLHQVSLDEDKILVGSYYSTSLGWTFYSRNSRNQLSRSFMENQKRFVLALTPLIIVIVILLLTLRKLLYSPISRVMQRIDSPDRPESAQADELKRLENWIDREETEKTAREKLLLKSLPAYQKSFLNRMLNGEAVSQRTAAAELKQLSLPLKAQSLRITCLFSEDVRQHHELLAQIRIWNFNTHNDQAVCLVRDNVVVYLTNRVLSYDACCQNLDDFIQNLYSSKGWPVRAAVSPGLWKISQLAEGFRQTLRILKEYLRVPFGTPVASLTTDYPLDALPLHIPEHMTGQWFSHIHNGDIRAAEKILLQTFSLVDSPAYNHHPGEIQHFYIRLAGALVSKLRYTGHSYDFMNDKGEDIFIVIAGQRTREQVLDILLSINNDAFNMVNTEDPLTKQLDYVNKAKELMALRLGSSISLSSIAADMNLSPAYLSRLFRQADNDSFINCLTNMRLEESRRLLENTSMKISEIAEKIGYWNSNYFIKVFRKHHGVTPGEFRRNIILPD